MDNASVLTTTDRRGIQKPTTIVAQATWFERAVPCVIAR
jgi:hypothetical protein